MKENSVENRALRVRSFIIDRLRAELVGPNPGPPAMQTGVDEPELREEEILRAQDSPRIRYGAGVLFPLRATVVEQQDDSTAEAEDLDETDGDENESDREGFAIGSGHQGGDPLESETEQEVNRANEYLPSAMGVTALVRLPETLRIEVEAGRYEHIELEGAEWTDSDGNVRPRTGWRRIPIHEEVKIPGDELLSPSAVSRRRNIETGAEGPQLQLHVYSRPLPGYDAEPRARMITFTLLNNTSGAEDRIENRDCFFQCGFSVSDAAGSACFLEYPRTSEVSEDPDDPVVAEERSLRLLYHERRVFAVGHGCAPEWNDTESAETDKIRTQTVPTFEIAPVVPAKIEELDTRMRMLARPDGEVALETGEKLCALYEKWIEGLEEEIPDSIMSDLVETAERHVRRARECLERMRGGVELLRSNRLALKAFALANKAMLMQQIHYWKSSQEIREWVSEKGQLVPGGRFKSPDYDSAENRWYPFQLAFLLMNLRSMVEREGPERDIVDVIWFPTGGGKTEAYLGLSAFTILLRRLEDPNNAGTTVLMRYTLRLLTTQQYQRAASLICALEIIRREESLGPPVRIGLWVGGSVSPNRERDAINELHRMQREGGGDNPFVLLSCPWCGMRMGAVSAEHGYRVKGYRKLVNPARVRHVCPDPECTFSDERGLPVLVVDEAIYENPTDLVIGTVDKFALLPWYPQARGLFGLHDEAVSPPDLIVQDELHLISGPLGSMVGHYETAVERLCRDDGGPSVKIIASTATIARAEEQVRSLYGREESFLFPPQGLKWGESFFAREASEKPGRIYAGVFATALPSQQTAMIRVLSALLQAPLQAPENDPKSLDAYWTLVGYFNSMRELGSAATLVSADIREYLRVLQKRLGITYRWNDEAREACRRLTGSTLELTSRVSRGQISEALDKLFQSYDGSQGSAVDVCLATNMIQVGLDVPRLGLMVVAGQPKTTAEYIQATSRVGRRLPGMVVTLFNPGKPRDRSHYEHFRAYHESIYRWVEPTSVTPFAIPVRERALHALVIILARYWGADRVRHRPNPPPPSELLDEIRSVILERAAEADADEVARTSEELNRLIERWEEDPVPRYGSFAPPDEEVPMMYPDSSDPLPVWGDRSLPTPSSMRNVDATCDAGVIGRYPRGER